VKEHKATFDENDLRDYTDYFIEEQQRQGESSTFTGIISENLVNDCPLSKTDKCN